MEDEVVDTPETPVETDAEISEPTEEPEVQEPTYITVDQMEAALTKQDASFRSWLGRRDKETFSHIGNVINERMNQGVPETNDEASTRLLENPRQMIRSEVAAYESERTTQQTTHLNSAMESVADLMDSDPLYKDEVLGNEIVQEVKKLVQTGRVNDKVHPSQAGRIVLADALTTVMRNRQNEKVNPLQNNSAANQDGGLKPPAKPGVKLKVPKLDAETKKLAEKWGYNDEDLARLYSE